MASTPAKWKPEFAKIGRFFNFTDIPAERQGKNLIKMISTWADTQNLHRPAGIALRLIMIPPNGSIPAHTHDTDNGSSWLVCMAGSGTHWVEIGGKRTEHQVRTGGSGVSTQKMRTDIGGLTYIHGFNASDEGLILLSIYNEAELSEKTLRDIQRGKQIPKRTTKQSLPPK
jgi:hypothetical protein